MEEFGKYFIGNKETHTHTLTKRVLLVERERDAEGKESERYCENKFIFRTAFFSNDKKWLFFQSKTEMKKTYSTGHYFNCNFEHIPSLD